MTLRFAIPKSGITIEAADSGELEDAYAGIGGSRQFLIGHITRSISQLETGALGPGPRAAAEALGAHVVAVQEQQDDGTTVEVDDPWASGPAERVTTPVRPAYNPQQSSGGGTQHKGDPAAYLGEDRFGSKFYRDPNAPNCDCGNQAIRKAAISQKGNAYSAWVCWNAGPSSAGADYKQKCSFSELPPRKGR